MISGPFKVENCMITHQDEMHPHVFIDTTGLIPYSIRLVFYIKSLLESVHLQLVSSTTGAKILNPVARTFRIRDELSTENPLLAFTSKIEEFSSEKLGKNYRHSYSQLSTLMPNTIVDIIGVIVELTEPRTCQGKG